MREVVVKLVVGEFIRLFESHEINRVGLKNYEDEFEEGQVKVFSEEEQTAVSTQKDHEKYFLGSVGKTNAISLFYHLLYQKDH